MKLAASGHVPVLKRRDCHGPAVFPLMTALVTVNQSNLLIHVIAPLALTALHVNSTCHRSHGEIVHANLHGL